MKTSISDQISNQPLNDLRGLQDFSLIIYDLIDQGLESIIKEEKIWDQEILLENASFSAKGRCIQKILDQQKLKVFRKWLKVARYGGYAKNDLGKLEEFIIRTQEISELLEVFQKDFEIRIPLQRKTINSATVDTRFGFRSINLSHSDLINEKTDLLILTSTYGTNPAGSFFERLINRCDFKVKNLTPFFFLDQFHYSSLIKGNDLTGFKNLLILTLPKRQDNSDYYVEKLNINLNTLISSSLAILEIQNKPIQTIALPVICGNYMYNDAEYDKLTRILLSITASWLKKSELSNEINIGVYFKNDLHHWNESLNKVLGRAPLDKGDLINELLRDFQKVLDRNCNGPLSSAILPMREILYNSDKIGIENFLILSRKLVELLVLSLANQFDIKLGGELLSNIEKLRQVRIAPWILSYMHTLRVFGNEGVHVRLDNKIYFPNQISEVDFISGITLLKALLIYWEGNLSNVK